MGKKKLVIFDFDGVLVDSTNFCFELNKKNNPDLTMEEYLEIFHGNLFDVLGKKKNPLARTMFHERYEEGICDFQTHTILSDVVASLNQRYILSIVSSGHEPAIKKFLEKENLLHLFSDVFGLQTHTSKVIKLTQLLDKYSIAPVDAVFVTDTLGDILEGHEVGIRSIAETWGFHNKETLEKGKPEIIIDDPFLLEETINKLLS